MLKLFVTLFIVVSVIGIGIFAIRQQEAPTPIPEIEVTATTSPAIVETVQPKVEAPQIASSTEKEQLPTKISIPVTKKDDFAIPTPNVPLIPELTITTYTCENDQTVSSRIYVALLGLHDNDATGVEARIRELSAADHKTKAVWVYDYSPTENLATISSDFTAKFNQLISTQNPDEVILFGRSAGGTIVSNSAHNLIVSGKAEIHTIASPLRGFNLRGFLEYFLGDKKGLEREVGQGFDPFIPAPNNFKIYHHKTVTDSVYAQNCGDFGALCPTPREIQLNNLFGSKEYYYPEYDHTPLMDTVTKLVIACRR